MLGIYIHIPFCERKCNYCAFSSFVQKDEIDGYINALIQEITDFCSQNSDEKYRKVDTIFIGGGTPSILSISQFEKIMKALKENFEFAEQLEFTIECNPNSLNEEKLLCYKSHGVNRISIGVQSLDDGQLAFIGRVHNKREAVEKIKQTLKIFDNVSVDLLIGIKGMEEDNFLNSLSTLANLGVKHFSTYMLQVEDGTPLAKLTKENPEILPSDEECIEVYNKTVDYLQKLNFAQYEVSNFAKEGYECKHNIKYWAGEDYAGFGLSAHSYINGWRYANSKTFKDYYDKNLALKEKLTTEQLIEEHIMLGLRCKKGIKKDYLLSLGYDITKNEYLKDYVKNGIIIENQNLLYLNPKFYGVNNFIIVHLLP